MLDYELGSIRHIQGYNGGFIIQFTKWSNHNSTTFNGTSTVTMKDGPITQVPTSIKLIGSSVLNIWLDPSKTKGHFGNTVIYGTQHLVCVEEPQDCK